MYKAILTPTKDLLHQIENRILVFELDINTKLSDEVYAFTGYKLCREKKNRAEARHHCESEGGQLASIHSQWEQTLAEKAAAGSGVWIGGKILHGHWQWADRSTWNFTKWKIGHPKDRNFLMMNSDGRWQDQPSWAKAYFLCQGTTVALKENGLARIEFERDQLDYLPYHVLFKSKAIKHELSKSSKEEASNKISGFSLNWFLEARNGTQVTEKLPAKQEDWNQGPSPAYKQPWLHQLVDIAMKLRLYNMTKSDILKEVIRQKSQTSAMRYVDEMCFSGQVRADYQKYAFSELASKAKTIRTSGEPLSEDYEVGYGIFHAMVFCPAMVFKMYNFIDHLLSNETSRTIIQTIVHLIQSGVNTDAATLTLLKQFYPILASALNLQYGNTLLAISTMAQLRAAKKQQVAFLHKQH